MSWKDILKDSARAMPKCATCEQEHYKHQECPETKKSIGTIARVGAAVLSDDDETKGIATAARMGALAIDDGEEKSDVEKLYGTHRQGTSDVADSMRDMVEQLQEIEEMGAMSAGISPEIQRAFNDATQALGKLQALLA